MSGEKLGNLLLESLADVIAESPSVGAVPVYNGTHYVVQQLDHGRISLTTGATVTAPASAAGIPFDTTIKKTGSFTHSPLGANNDEVTLDAAGTIEVLFTVSLEGA